jgi:hypothetical protein
MNNRYRLLMISLVAMLAAGGVSVYWHQSPTNRISEKSYYLIKKGDTQSDVEKVLGVPPGNYSGGATVMLSNTAFRQDRLVPNMFSDILFSDELWIGKDFCISVQFDPDGRVQDTKSYFVYPSSSFLEKYRSWLGW